MFDSFGVVQGSIRRNQYVVGRNVRLQVLPVLGFKIVPESTLQRFTARDVGPLLRLALRPHGAARQHTHGEEEQPYPDTLVHGAILQQPSWLHLLPTFL